MKFYFLIALTLLSVYVKGSSSIKPEKPVLISERILLATDRKIYIAGENLLFSLYLIDKKNNSLADYNSIGYVVLRNTNGDVLGKSQVKIDAGKATGAIYLSDTLISGYYQVVAYTNYMRNGSPDIYCKTQVLIANRFDKDFFGLISQQQMDSTLLNPAINENNFVPAVNIITSKGNFGKREKVSLKINLQNPETKYSDLTISVVEKNAVENLAMTNLTRSASVSKGALLNGDKALNTVFLAEDRFAELGGRITDASNGNPIAYHVLYLSSPDTVANFEYAVSDARGFFRFPLSDYYNGKDLFIKVKEKEGETLYPKVSVDLKFQYNDPFTPAIWPIDSSLINYLKNSQNIVRIQKSFFLVQSQYQPIHYKSEIPYLFKVPDFSVVPADYTELNDFVEISRELIPALKIRRHDKDYSAEILDVLQRRYLSTQPLIFLDGIIIDNINSVISFGTKDVSKISMINTTWYVDHQEIPGVLSIYSHNGLWKNLTLNSNNYRIKAENYYELPNLYQTNYSVIDVNSREPDFRQLLYWNPKFHLDSSDTVMVEFYTSDYAGSYIVKVTGVNERGDKIEAYREFEVTEN